MPHPQAALCEQMPHGGNLQPAKLARVELTEPQACY